jgi:hypothetical protein
MVAAACRSICTLLRVSFKSEADVSTTFAGQLHGLTDFWIPFFLNTQDRLCQTELKSIEVNDRMLTRLFKAQTGVAKHQILVNAIHAHSNNSVLCSISLSQIEVDCKVTSSNVYWSQARRCQQ